MQTYRVTIDNHLKPYIFPDKATAEFYINSILELVAEEHRHAEAGRTNIIIDDICHEGTMKCPICHKDKLFVPRGVFEYALIRCGSCGAIFKEVN